MRVLVTGGTGFVGSHSVAALVSQGHQVRLLVRSRDRVASSLSVFPADSRTAQRVCQTNVCVAEIILGAAVRRGLDPVVHVSSVAALLPPDGAVLTSDSPVKRPLGTYSRSKAESEQIARRYQEQGVPVVIVYPGGAIGPDDPYLGARRYMITGHWASPPAIC